MKGSSSAKVPLHGRAAADPGVASQLRRGGFVLVFFGDSSRASPSMRPSTEESMWQNDVGFHGKSFLVHPSALR
jgi:hypothetical protein